jgi:hypothetical protein
VKENALKLAEQRIAVLESDSERLALLAQVDSLARQLAAAEAG